MSYDACPICGGNPFECGHVKGFKRFITRENYDALKEKLEPLEKRIERIREGQSEEERERDEQVTQEALLRECEKHKRVWGEKTLNGEPHHKIPNHVWKKAYVAHLKEREMNKDPIEERDQSLPEEEKISHEEFAERLSHLLPEVIVVCKFCGSPLCVLGTRSHYCKFCDTYLSSESIERFEVPQLYVY